VPRVINIEEGPARVVGRRVPPDPLAGSGDTRQEAEAWRRAFDTPFIPRGVYRFATHEEADAWMWAMITRPRRRR
jgi:hypothetical protein